MLYEPFLRSWPKLLIVLFMQGNKDPPTFYGDLKPGRFSNTLLAHSALKYIHTVYTPRLVCAALKASRDQPTNQTTFCDSDMLHLCCWSFSAWNDPPGSLHLYSCSLEDSSQHFYAATNSRTASLFPSSSLANLNFSSSFSVLFLGDAVYVLIFSETPLRPS